MIFRRTRREILRDAGWAGVGLSFLPQLLAEAAAARDGTLSSKQRRTLHAAVARIVPAQGPGDWSAADVGADSYILYLLDGTSRIYAGGPVRKLFSHFQRLTRVKQIGWSREVRRLRKLYRAGLAELDQRSGGNFVALPSATQDAILTELDDSGDPFFTALFNHTMEGVYAHPIYGGNRDYRAWRTFGYAGDVHGVRFPHLGPPNAPWNVFGGYAPQEMVKPGREGS